MLRKKKIQKKKKNKVKKEGKMKKTVLNVSIKPETLKKLKQHFKDAGIPTSKEEFNQALAITKRKMRIDGAPKKEDMH